MFRVYVTDSLQSITNMYNKAHGGNGEVVIKRFFDLIHPSKPKKEETADEIIDRIKKKLGN